MGKLERGARIAVGLIALASIAGCRGKEIARVKLSAPDEEGETTWKPGAKRKAVLWASYEGKWKGPRNDPSLGYEIELVDGDKTIEKVTCSTDSCGARVCSSTVHINDDHRGSCECKMTCTLEAPGEGAYTVKVKVVDRGDFYEPKDLSLVLRE